MPRKQVRSQLTSDDLTAVVTRKSIRNIRIRVNRNGGEIRVSAPHGTRDDDIRQLLQQHRDWIITRQLENQNRPSPRLELIDGAQLCVLGEPHVLRIQNGGRLRSVQCVDAVVFMSIRKGDGPGQIQMLVDKWIDGELRSAVTRLAETYAPQMGVTMGPVAVRAMRSRWGSCNIRTGRICVNRALAWESPELLEYIVVHELAHLLEPGHTRRFYAVVDAHFPGRKAAEARLRTLSRSL